MAKNYFDRYVWLIELINRHGYIKYEDISRANYLQGPFIII